MFTPFNIFLAVLAIAVVLLIHRVFLGPKLETLIEESRRAAVDRHCRLALVKALWDYRKDDYGLEVPEEVMRFLKSYFHSSVLEYALTAARYGHVDIYIDSWGVGDRGIRYKFLNAFFEDGKLAYAYFTTR